ncbi:quinone-dependent dihydroorotate dehydrogenase [Halovulum sp. GXIMD14793]
MKRLIERVGLAALRQLDPEQAHKLALRALHSGLAPLPQPVSGLSCQVAGLRLANPVGLAAGFDKNADAIGPLLHSGLGFIEVGAVTPKPQPGNPKPRLFRLPEDKAVINRFGFNNDGMERVAERLSGRPKTGTLGLNLGTNKDSEDRAADYGKVLACCAAHLDFATINVSSPNTEKLRDLQGPDALRAVLNQTQSVNAGLPRPLPLFVKIAPDLDDAALDDIVNAVTEADLAGIVATNTTLDRTGLNSRHKDQAGGLSGVPLFAKSTAVLRALRARTDLPLIGVGGISSAKDALEKLDAGADALQLYSALTYHGFGLIDDILRAIKARSAPA